MILEISTSKGRRSTAVAVGHARRGVLLLCVNRFYSTYRSNDITTIANRCIRCSCYRCFIKSADMCVNGRMHGNHCEKHKFGSILKLLSQLSSSTNNVDVGIGVWIYRDKWVKCDNFEKNVYSCLLNTWTQMHEKLCHLKCLFLDAPWQSVFYLAVENYVR